MHSAAPQFVHYVPIATTVLSGWLCFVLARRYAARRSGPHLVWWAFGMFAYGLGTGLESCITLFGNSIGLNKAWYIAGALLGGYPLAQGTVFLLLEKRRALILTTVTVPFICLAAILVILSPVNAELLEAHRPSGAILQWQWVRLMTPFINLYAVVFLIGGAFFSAIQYARTKQPGNGQRSIGNVFIAAGAILPGVGGSMAKAGIVEALYIGEFVGLLLIWAGFHLCVTAGRVIDTNRDRELAASITAT